MKQIYAFVVVAPDLTAWLHQQTKWKVAAKQKLFFKPDPFPLLPVFFILVFIQ